MPLPPSQEMTGHLGKNPFSTPNAPFPKSTAPECFVLANLDSRRAMTSVRDGFNLDRRAKAKAWVAQHACVVVDGHLGGSCASCHYNSVGGRCPSRNVGSTRESVKVAAGASEKGKSPQVFDGGVLVLNGHPTATRAITRTRARTRATTTSRQLSQTASRGSTMSPARIRSASPEPRKLSPTPAFLRASRDSIEETYEWCLRLARMQDPNGRILSRRRHEAAIMAFDQVEMEEEAERREGI
ncbi:hypothetical protein V498_03968 [Pseudogymnoascus sp. VKM F-4517 (FW-2822)]|nr:hypothetical protein V498_03968 [Pseudogymnoascus sp. VKM F-4517 (FW-2822)]